MQHCLIPANNTTKDITIIDEESVTMSNEQTKNWTNYQAYWLNANELNYIQFCKDNCVYYISL